MNTNNGRTEEATPKPKATLVGGHGRLPLQLAPAPSTMPATHAMTGRATVLPRRASADSETTFEMAPRFQHVKTLGEGAMGRVELVRDNDIRRTVAVKHLIAGMDSPAALSRFADEVRVIGQLEHPGIVPIYDVDRGENGQVYLVMKHLQGETMEQVIEHLRSDDPEYVARYTPEYRVRIFLGVLDAMSYAHARRILHRDLKPANIMIGPYGEVTVVDWGIAKPMHERDVAGRTDPLARTMAESHDARVVHTQAGRLAGTPMYMSPEQAAGLNDDLDERSDVYSLCVVLYEWLVLEHPLRDKASMAALLASIVLNDYALAELFGPAQSAGVPMEYMWIIWRGLVRDREKRYQSVKELEAALSAVQDGRIQVQCNITWTKNRAQRFVHWIDRHPKLFTLLFRGARGVAGLAVAGGIGVALWRCLAHIM